MKEINQAHTANLFPMIKNMKTWIFQLQVALKNLTSNPELPDGQFEISIDL